MKSLVKEAIKKRCLSQWCICGKGLQGILRPAKITVANDNKTHFPSVDVLSHNISRLFSVKRSSASSLSNFIELNV